MEKTKKRKKKLTQKKAPCSRIAGTPFLRSLKGLHQKSKRKKGHDVMTNFVDLTSCA